MKSNKNYKVLTILVNVGIVLTAIVLVGLPMGLTAVFKVSTITMKYTPAVMALILSVGIYICALPYVIALFQLKTVCKLIVTNDQFNLKISKAFDKISNCAFIEAVLFVAVTLALFFGFGFYVYALTILSTIVVLFISVVAGYLFKVLSTVFYRAHEMKEENDLTF